MKNKLLFLFTRTPLHIGAGISLGTVDHPLWRERHTQFPAIPGSALKGAFAGLWTDASGQRTPEGGWLFGGEQSGQNFAGAVQFSEGRLLAFPIRSARSGFAWITSPLILRRWARDGGLPLASIPALMPRDDQALFAKNGLLSLGDKIVLEEYTFAYAGEIAASGAPATTAGAEASRAGPSKPFTDYLRSVAGTDPVWSQIATRMVVVSDGMMSFFAQSACEIAQRVALDDARGAARKEAFFSQENIPAESLFYACLNLFEDRVQQRPAGQGKSAAEVFSAGIQGRAVQIGADASIGLGWCSVELAEPVN